VSLKYDDFDLEITPAGDKYRVHLNGPTGQAAADFVLPFTDMDVSNFLGRIGQVRRSMRRAEAPELHAAKDFGGKLFSALFTGELIAQLRGSVEQSLNNDRGLRIRLRLTDAPELADLPWEFLYDSAQNHFLTTSTETPLVRFLDLPQRIAPVRATLPLRVLVVIASPKNLKRLDAEGEWQRLQDALADLLRGGHIVLERLPSATIDALRLRARGAPFHIFHFIGHGGFDTVAEDGVLQFEDDNGMSYPVRGEMLGMQLHDHRSLRLAVLNACEGARSSRQDPFSGVAQSLLQQRVPAVIAMQFEISDAAAKVFAREFYCAIAEGNPVDAAVCESRKALFNEEFGQEWATPVLYMRSHEGQLFDLQGPAAAVLDTSSVDRGRADTERRAAEIAAAERAATAEKEREETERSEQARLAASKAEALRCLAQKAQAERIATSEKERQEQEQEQAERERLASEKANAEHRATEKAETERAAAEAERQRQAPEQMAGTNLARAATPLEPLAAQIPPTPLAAALASPPPTPRRGLPMWQILLLFIPFLGLVLALSWHHLRPHSETARSPETPASETRDANPEPPASQMSSAIAAPKHPAEASPKPASQEEPPSPKPSSAASPKPDKGDLAPSKAANTKPNEKRAAAEKPAAPPPLEKSAGPPSRLRITWIAQKAKIVSQVSPVYPPEAIQGNITGAVELDVIIAKDGTVQSAASTSGQPLLAQAAIDSIKQWRFSPTMVNNQPVEIETAVPFTFSLKKNEPASSTASAAQTPPAKSAPCTLGRVDFQDAGTRLVGAVPYTYTGGAQVQTLALVGIPMTADKKEIPGVSLGETTLQVASGTASFSIDAHPSLGKTGPRGDSVLVMVVVKSTNEMVCSKLVPYQRTW
jgi:TonB family protein